MGIEKFNQACRESVLRYTREWQDYVTRQARWVDFDHDYKTLDLSYMESVMWAFKQLWDKGLVYQGFKVLPYCWRCETPLSNHELRMDEDTYAERQDPSVTVRFKLETGEWLLAWTTTPWTLPSNLACAVGADISYVVLAKDGERYILARDRQAAYERELEGAAVVGTLTGAELAGRRYEPLLPYLADTETFGTQDAFRVILSDDVTTEDGTGVVHMAPAYGEADALARATRPASRPCSPWTTRAGSPAWCPTSRASTSSTRTSRDHREAARPGQRWCARRPTRTPTRTAGAAVTR